jgi:E3 ubiquitin-protein ligase HUWE1
MDALSDFDDASENLDGDSDNDIADGMLLDAEDLDTPFLREDLNDELVMEGDEFERARPIIPVGIRRRFNNGRRSFIEGGKTLLKKNSYI